MRFLTGTGSPGVQGDSESVLRYVKTVKSCAGKYRLLQIAVISIHFFCPDVNRPAGGKWTKRAVDRRAALFRRGRGPGTAAYMLIGSPNGM